MPDRVVRLRAVKLVHTLAWGVFAGSIVVLPFAARRAEFRLALALIALVLVEVLVLAANGLRCPLTAVAARYTDDRADNFDIYLPRWVARHNKVIFGAWFLAGVAYTAACWLARRP